MSVPEERIAEVPMHVNKSAVQAIPTKTGGIFVYLLQWYSHRQ
jgi:hypothetical protein